MRVVVTGGAGFIGSHIVDALIERGDAVAIIDDLSTGSPANVNPAARMYRAHIAHRDAADAIRRFRPDAVCHQAGQASVARSVRDPVGDAKINVLGGLNVLGAAASIGAHIVFASTGGALYGDTLVVPTPESYFPLPVSQYGVAKLAVEHYLRAFAAQQPLSYVVLRYANVYGPRQSPTGESGVVARLCDAIVAGQRPTITGDGRQTRDFVHVRDVVRANLIALSERETGTYNIGTGIRTDVNTVYRLVAGSLGSSLRPQYVPLPPGEQRDSALDSRLAAEQLGWRPEIEIGPGVVEAAEWFREHGRERYDAGSPRAAQIAPRVGLSG